MLLIKIVMFHNTAPVSVHHDIQCIVAALPMYILFLILFIYNNFSDEQRCAGQKRLFKRTNCPPAINDHTGDLIVLAWIARRNYGNIEFQYVLKYCISVYWKECTGHFTCIHYFMANIVLWNCSNEIKATQVFLLVEMQICEKWKRLNLWFD